MILLLHQCGDADNRAQHENDENNRDYNFGKEPDKRITKSLTNLRIASLGVGRPDECDEKGDDWHNHAQDDIKHLPTRGEI